MLLVGSAAVVAFLVGDAWIRAGFATAALLAPWPLLGLWGVYVALFASVVRTDAAGVRLQNLLRRTDIPWGAITDIGLRFQLVIMTTAGDRYTAFGGPAAARPRSSPFRGEGPGIPRALQDTDRIREDWEAAVAAGAAAGTVRRTWDVPAACIGVLLLLWAVSAVIVAYG